MTHPQPSLSYRDAGVDIEAADRAKRSIRALIASTATEGTLSEIGSFGGMFKLPPGLRNPVLVASTDGVGTKLKLAFRTGRHAGIGEDLVNHCVNDILVQGARPLFFLDYIGTGRLDENIVREIVEGVARGCRANGCALLGGETAEMPEFYADGEYDLAGTIVGVVEEGQILDGTAVREGDALIGLASSGLHTNGYSLARRIVFERGDLGVDSELPGTGRNVADVLLDPHRSYLPFIEPLLDSGSIRALAHITGGGILDNLPRVLPADLGAVVRRGSWTVPPLFGWLQKTGGVAESEMFRTFNMGIGMICVVREADVTKVLEHIGSAGCEAWLAGEIVLGTHEVVLA